MLRKIKDKSKLIIKRRLARTRYKLKKLNTKPRLSVFVSNVHIYAQVIDDQKGITLASASTIAKDLKSTIKKTSNIEAAKLVGKFLATNAVKAGVKEVVFDRGSKMHGVEGPSTDKPTSNLFPQHRLCRDLGISHFEWLVNLEKVVGKGEFQFIGLPIKFKGGSGSPVRAVAVINS